MRGETRCSLGLVAVVLAISACGGTETPGVCRGVDESRTVVSEGPGQWERQERSPELVELWRAGGLKEGQGMTLPVGIAAAPDGRIAIPDFQPGQTFLVGPDGTWRGSWTGQGQGPAEVLRPVAARWSDDGRLAVFDIQGSKVVWLEGPGKAVDQQNLDADFTSPVMASGSLRWAAVGPDGTAWLRTGPRSLAGGARAVDVVTRLRASAEMPDTVLRDTVPTVAAKGRFARTILPGAPRPVATVGPDGALWLVDSDGRYILYRQGGSEDQAIPFLCRETTPLRLSARERAEEGVGGEEELAAAIRGAPEPDRLASTGELLVGEDGRIWVQRKRPTPFGRDALYGPPGGQWDVFAGDGSYLGSVKAPSGARLQAAAGDTVWAFEIGELDEVRVVAYEVRPDGGRR